MHPIAPYYRNQKLPTHAIDAIYGTNCLSISMRHGHGVRRWTSSVSSLAGQTALQSAHGVDFVPSRFSLQTPPAIVGKCSRVSDDDLDSCREDAGFDGLVP